MGYYTDYTLEVRKYPEQTILSKDDPRFDELCLALKSFGVFDDSVMFSQNGVFNGEAKWYENRDDMLELSKHFPEYLFTLYGNGEDDDDLWVCYFLNGKEQFADAKIVYDEFDPDKLECRK